LGQKVNPIGFRLGINKTWDSRWFAGKDYARFVYEDHEIRKFLRKRLSQAGVAKIGIFSLQNRSEREFGLEPLRIPAQAGH